MVGVPGCPADTSPFPQEEEGQLLARDCVAALEYCLDRSKGFHKARYRLAKVHDEFEGDTEKAAEEMRHLFGRQRKLFAIAVESLTDTDSQVRRVSRGRPLLSTAAGPAGDAVSRSTGPARTRSGWTRSRLPAWTRRCGAASLPR